MRRNILLVAVAAWLGAAPAAAYDRALTPAAIREAVFLGYSTSDKPAAFLKQYVQTFPVPPAGMYVSEIEITTPYKRIVQRARTAFGYSPLAAEADNRRQPQLITVTVTVWLTPTVPAHTPYTRAFPGFIALRDPNFYETIEVHLKQSGHVEQRARRGQPVYLCSSTAGLGGGLCRIGCVGCALAGAEIELDFDPDQLASRPTRILVKTEDGREVEAEFDLAKLR